MDWVCESVLPRETRKLAAEIEKKDTQLALLIDNLAERNNHIQAIQHENVALQTQRDVYHDQVQDLIHNRHVPRRNLIDNVLCFIDKNSDEQHQFYIIRCQQRRLENYKKCLRNRYPNMIILGECDDANAVHRWCQFKEDAIQDFYRNHFNLDEEGREIFETAFDIAV